MRKSVRLALGIVAGGIVGFAYYSFIGCRSGTCPITSNPTTSILYGAVVGLLFAWPSKPKPETEPEPTGGEDS